MYAIWKLTNYKITYNLNGGVNNELNPETYTMKKAVTFYEPTKERCDFLGWYLDSNFKTKVTGIAKGTKGNKEVYAKWSEGYLVINYNLDGGTNNDNNVNKFWENDEVTLYNPTKKGYNFEGWYTDEEFNNKIEKIESGTEEDVNLYAKWSKIQYSITYHLNDGINNENNVITYTITDKVTFYEPTK